MLAEVAIVMMFLPGVDTVTVPDRLRDPIAAVRSTTPVELDGRLTEAAWATAPVTGGFRQQFPDWGAPGSERTEVRVLYDAEALYVAVRAHAADPATIVAPLTRRDDTGGGDRISVFIDSWHDRRTGFAFTLSAAGVRSDAYMYDDSESDQSWDATWEGATSRDSEGWTAEFRIPFTQLRFSSGEQATTFGFNVARTVAARNEVVLWQLVPQDGAQFVSRFGELTGLERVVSGRRIEILPYLTGRQTGGRAVVPGAGGSNASGGVDLRVGLGSSLTLSAAVNPDFGQLDGDPAEVNLSANETFFEERRRFFTEASDAFLAPIATAGEETLVYSRRIGRAPQLAADPRGGTSVTPGETTILGAAKLTGKTRSGWTVATLAALTQEERASVVAATGEHHVDIVEPRTLYGVVRVGRDLRQGRSVLSGMATVVRRDLTEATVSRLREGAVVVGGDLLHRFGAREAYRLRASLTTSSVTGSAEAIAATQRSALRFYQRPDNTAAHYDPTRTALAGSAALVELARQAGDWRWNLEGTYRTPGFEPNDLGYMRSADFTFLRGRVARRWAQLGALSNTELGLEYRYWGTSRFERINHGAMLATRATLGNGWQVATNTWLRFGGMDPGSLRGGPAMHESGNLFQQLKLTTDPSRRVALETTLGTWRWFDAANGGLRVETGLTWRPAPRAELGLGATLSREHWAPQLLARAQVAGAEQYLVSDVQQRTLSTTLRAGLTFSRTLTLQLWAQPFTSANRFVDPRRVAAPRATSAADRYAPVELVRAGGRLSADLDGDGTSDVSLAEPDFTSTSIRSNLVLRWEYQPSSTLFLVWQHDRSHDGSDGIFRPGRAFDDLLGAPGRNQLAIKVSYWLNMR